MPPDAGALSAVETLLGARFDVVSFFQAWQGPYARFDSSWFDAVRAVGRIPLLTWEPWSPPHVLPRDLAEAPGGTFAPSTLAVAPSTDQPAFRLRAIARGGHDAHVREWARALAARADEVWLRPMHEMNGSWYPWCGTTNGNAPGDFVPAWRSLVEVFRSEGASNVRWVWSPYVRSYPPSRGNELTRYFPGDDVVDWVGLNAFNWYSVRPEARWEELSALVEPALRAVRGLSSRPVFISETACPPGPERPAWIHAAIRWAKEHELRGVVWFNAAKECDWRLESDEAAIAAWRATTPGR